MRYRTTDPTSPTIHHGAAAGGRRSRLHLRPVFLLLAQVLLTSNPARFPRPGLRSRPARQARRVVAARRLHLLLRGQQLPASPAPVPRRLDAAASSAGATTRSRSLNDVDYEASSRSARICASVATPAGPDAEAGSSLSLCLFVREFGLPYPRKIEPPRAVELHLDPLNASERKMTCSSLPDLVQDPLLPTRPISAAGHLWAPYFTQRCPPRLMMRRLDKESGQWVEVGDAFQHGGLECAAIHGYAVVRDDTILLSMQPAHFFLAFHCSTFNWTVVATVGGSKRHEYVTIPDRGLYVEEDDTVYFLRDSTTVYAYNLCGYQDQGRHWYSMAPPTVVDHVFPFRCVGYGFLTYLGCRIMCAAWIGVPPFRYAKPEIRCNCDTLHMLITTFRVVGGNEESMREPFVRKSVHVLHSTCRRVDGLLPSMPSDCRLCFLQEYKEFSHNENAMALMEKKTENAMEPSTLLEFTEASSSRIFQVAYLEFVNESPFIDAVMLERSAIKISIKKALYIICQNHSSSTVYEISVLDGRLSCHDKTLTRHCVMDAFVCDDAHDLMERPRPWHFVCDRKPIGDEHVSIALIVGVGHKIVAISDPLDRVYYLHDGEWKHLMTCQPVDLGRKIQLSGHAVLNDESFLVSDAESCYCYLFSLDNGTRRVVRPYSEFSKSQTSYWSLRGFLSGRSVFAEGFIYTCRGGGLAAYEIFEAEDSCCIGSQIYFRMPWRNDWKTGCMCLDYLGKDVNSGAIIFCVVQGDQYYNYLRPGALAKPSVWTTTIQVKTERMPNGKQEPVAIGHLDISTSFIEQDVGSIWTTGCFAL
ncbi:hypothetical protein EJB05_45240, partial [Eragrostis curvula]